MRQILLQNATAILLQNTTEVYYKMRQLLQNATLITNCDSTTRQGFKEVERSKGLCNKVFNTLITGCFK